MAKSAQTKKVSANKLKAGDKIVFHKLVGIVKTTHDADKDYPVFGKGVLCVRIEGAGGPWMKVEAPLLIKDTDMLEIERCPGPISWACTSLANWLLKF